MGRPAVCALSNLPIPDMTDVRLMYIRANNVQNVPIFPFEMYMPMTPFVKTCYREDDYFDWDHTGERKKLISYLRLYKPNFKYNDSCDNSVLIFKDHTTKQDRRLYPIMVREDVLQFAKTFQRQFYNRKTSVSSTCTISEFHEIIRESYFTPLREAIAQIKEKCQRWSKRKEEEPENARFITEYETDLKLQLHHNHGYFQLTQFFTNLFEGHNDDACQHVVDATFKSIDPEKSAEEIGNHILEGLDPLFDVIAFYYGLQRFRKYLVPHGTCGSQQTCYDDVIMIADFLKETATKLKKETEDED